MGIHSGEDVANDPVFARSVERLQHHQQGLAAVGVEQVLQLPQALEVGLDFGDGFLMSFVLPGIGRIDL